MHQSNPIFIYEVMILTCSIQALDDNNREVWFSSGVRSAGKHPQHGCALWDDVTTLQNKQSQFTALRQEVEGRQTVWHTQTNTHTHCFWTTWHS